ncbi:MAG: 2-oxo-4-hydroxy-4-carboxy-5-ureidoimidazoline decarboxylase [Zoogloea sp.]|nr:2-oxo-4-hydroxy-4-carboxy-5-ureidoimidazoline decarboxylase [Zoogloea sp.]
MMIHAMSASALSQMDQPAFVAALDGIFEHSPWVAGRAWPQRPFASREALLDSLVDTLRSAPRSDQLALIRAHPELAGKRAMHGALSAASIREQVGAGLLACMPEEFALIRDFNTAYKAKFGFPFVIAMSGLWRGDIIAAMARRLAHEPEVEFAEALAQIARIAALRLAERVAD